MPPRYHRKIIRIRAEDSPNVRYALKQIRLGLEVTHEVIVPGVLTYAEYLKRRDPRVWDKVRQCIGLDAQFWEGASVLLFPPEWLNLAELRARELTRLGIPRQATAIGIDPAEGGDKTAMAAVDQYGLVELVSKQTPNTAVITGEALAFMQKHSVPPRKVCWDRGGGGKEHADRLYTDYGVETRTIAFGESLTLDPKRGLTMIEDRLENKAERYVYVNRRAQMYYEAAALFDPSINDNVYAIDASETELRRQLAPIPRMTDPEGRLKLLPKNKRAIDSKEPTLTELIGCSPDEADAFVLAVHANTHEAKVRVAGAIGVGNLGR